MKRIITMALLLAVAGAEASQQSNKLAAKGSRRRVSTKKPKDLSASTSSEDGAFQEPVGKPALAEAQARVADLEAAVQGLKAQAATGLADRDTEIASLKAQLEQLQTATTGGVGPVDAVVEDREIMLPYYNYADLEKMFGYFRSSAARSMCQLMLNPDEMAKLTSEEQSTRTAQKNTLTALRQKAFDPEFGDSVPTLIKLAMESTTEHVQSVYSDGGNGAKGLRYALTILLHQNNFSRENPGNSFVMGTEDRGGLVKGVEAAQETLDGAINHLSTVMSTLAVIKDLANNESSASTFVQKMMDAAQKTKEVAQTTDGGATAADTE